MGVLPDPFVNALRFFGFVVAKETKDRIGTRRAAARVALLLAMVGPGMGCNNGVLLIPDPSVRYIAFGDSSTAGRSDPAYPEILSERLGQSPGVTANQGRGGETTGAGLHRLRDLLSRSMYPNADTLLYWEGGADIIHLIQEVDGQLQFSPITSGYPFSVRLTDTLDRVQANIEAAIIEAQRAGLTVYVATYFFLREASAPCDPLSLQVIQPSQAQNANEYVSLLNERIRQAALNTGAIVVDVASANETLHAEDSNFVDCNHLSETGNAIIARLFAQAIGQGSGE